MILRTEHFAEQFVKIAQAITSLETSSTSKSSSSSGSGYKDPSKDSYYKPRRRNFRVRTFSQFRDKADLQPLHKDSKSIKNPPDVVTFNKMYNKQDYLSGIKDNRMLDDHLRNK